MVRSSTRGVPIRLTPSQRKKTRKLQRKADVDALTARRARVLELLDMGWRQCDVEEATGAGIATVGRVRRRFLECGFDAAVRGRKAPGAKRLLSADEESRIVALACSDPPDGRATWTTALLAQVAVRDGIVVQAGRETVRLVLKHHGLKPWREKNVVRAGTGQGIHRPDGEPPSSLR
jgi:putative transposase